MKKRIKLLAEYFAPPLWILQDGIFIPIEPDKLGLSEGLVSQLNNWAEKYNSRLNLEDPKASSFLAGEELLSFDEEGKGLWKKITSELSSGYDVEYFGIKERKVLGD